MSIDFLCKMAAKFGSESGTCECTKPSECPFGTGGQQALRKLRAVFEQGKLALDRIKRGKTP